MAKVAFILTQGFADWEYAFTAGAGRGYYGLECRFFAPQPGKVESLGGIVVEVDHGVDRISAWEPNIVVVVGGTIWDSPAAPDISAMLQDNYARGATLAGICGGTLALARAGLLNENEHTSNSLEFLQENVGAYVGAACYCQRSAAFYAKRIITAPGTAPASFAAAIFESAGVEDAAIEEFRERVGAEHELFR